MNILIERFYIEYSIHFSFIPSFLSPNARYIRFFILNLRVTVWWSIEPGAKH